LNAFYDEEIFKDMPEKEAWIYGDRTFTQMMYSKVVTVQLINRMGYDVLYNFWAFLIKFDFAGIGDNGAELTFMEAQLLWIKNINKTEVSIDAHNTKADGRPAVLFHDPNN